MKLYSSVKRNKQKPRDKTQRFTKERLKLLQLSLSKAVYTELIGIRTLVYK